MAGNDDRDAHFAFGASVSCRWYDLFNGRTMATLRQLSSTTLKSKDSEPFERGYLNERTVDFEILLDEILT